MPTNSEAPSLNLEYYRKQAKALLKAARSGDNEAIQRLASHSQPGAIIPALHDAQRTIALENGFQSWPRFKAFLVQSKLDLNGIVTPFLDAALSDLRRAEEMLASHPQIARAGLHAALVLGESAQVQEAVQEIPGFVSSKGGARNWEPLLYVCFSRFAGGKSSRSGALVETAETVLRHGADPNASYVDERWPDSPLSCLYGATGINNNPALALALLKAGANPNDSESLYHSTEHPDLACMKLLLEHGASIKAANALKHMLDREDVEGLRLLLATGANPNEVNDRGETALHWAVWRRRSARIVAMLLDSGAAVDARRTDGRTAYALAVRDGRTDIAALLATRGASTNISVLDRFIAECVVADPNRLDRLTTDAPQMVAMPEFQRLLPDLASSNRCTAVRGLLAAGVPVDSRGELGGTALHWACWKGYADLVKLLLDHGAGLAVEDEEFHGTPPGWFAHGLQNCGERGGDYPRVARLLLAAGAKIPECDVPTGDIEVVLREYGLIQ